MADRRAEALKALLPETLEKASNDWLLRGLFDMTDANARKALMERLVAMRKMDAGFFDALIADYSAGPMVGFGVFFCIILK